MEPYNWRHYYDYANCRFELGEDGDAREYFIKATEMHGDFSIDVSEKLFETLYRMEKYGEALMVIEALVLADPKNYIYLGKMGMSFFGMGDYGKSFEAFNRSILLNRNVPEYLYGAGISAAHLNRTQDVINIVRDLLEMDGDFIEIIESEPTFREMKGREEFLGMLDKWKKDNVKESSGKATGVIPAVGLKKIDLPGIKK